MTLRLGLFGGSFNPVHFGHLIASRAVAEALGLDRVVLIPSANPPHKNGENLASAADRLEMVRLAVAGDRLFEVSDIELLRSGPSYTVDTVAAFGAERPGADLCWIIGADSLPELATWSRVQRLVSMVRMVVAARPGWRTPDLGALRGVVGDEAVERLVASRLETPEIGISASDIRSRVAAGQSVRYLVPESVVAYIASRGLYGGSARAKTDKLV